jgi:hypothetical protein
VEGSAVAREDRSPAETFLRTFVTASGADEAALVVLDPGESTWKVEAYVGEEGSRMDARDRRARAVGHPLTWCMREELMVQLSADELMPGHESGGWALAGCVPGATRLLVVSFGASPPIGAREALEAALAHLGSLHQEGLLGPFRGNREPLSGSTGSEVATGGSERARRNLDS